MHTRFAGAVSKKLTVLLCVESYSSCRQLVLAVSYFGPGISGRHFLAVDAIATRRPGREIMESRPHVSFAILTFTAVAAGALLLEHTGFFAGAFRREIWQGSMPGCGQYQRGGDGAEHQGIE